MCFIEALLLQSIMNLVSGVCLSRIRCADWCQVWQTINLSFSATRWVWAGDTKQHMREKRREEKGVVERSSRNVHTLCEVPWLCDKVWRVRKGRLRAQGKASAHWSCAYMKKRSRERRRKWMYWTEDVMKSTFPMFPRSCFGQEDGLSDLSNITLCFGYISCDLYIKLEQKLSPDY